MAVVGTAAWDVVFAYQERRNNNTVIAMNDGGAIWRGNRKYEEGAGVGRNTGTVKNAPRRRR